jgi:AcrR family transcriptional regulator
LQKYITLDVKPAIIATATPLFAAQGYEATTTLQIARKVGVTEPAVFYYFKNKQSLFSAILEAAASIYFQLIEELDFNSCEPFACLEALIRIHFAIVAEKPEHMHILLRTCPARLEEPENTCTKIYCEARSRLKRILIKILEKGMVSGEFIQVDIDATANMLIAIINGLMRQQIAALDSLEGVEQATIKFCRNALAVTDTSECGHE